MQRKSKKLVEGVTPSRPLPPPYPDTKTTNRRPSRHCSWGPWPRFPHLPPGHTHQDTDSNVLIRIPKKHSETRSARRAPLPLEYGSVDAGSNPATRSRIRKQIPCRPLMTETASRRVTASVRAIHDHRPYSWLAAMTFSTPVTTSRMRNASPSVLVRLVMRGSASLARSSMASWPKP